MMDGHTRIKKFLTFIVDYWMQLSELWAMTLKVRRDPKKIVKALRHSFAVIPPLYRTYQQLLHFLIL